jgi:hypothetical protein
MQLLFLQIFPAPPPTPAYLQLSISKLAVSVVTLSTGSGDIAGIDVKVMVLAGNEMIFFTKDRLHKSWLVPTQVYRRN